MARSGPGRDPKNYKETDIPGIRAAICVGCGAFRGYSKDWSRHGSYCTASCVARRPWTPDEERNRSIATIYTDLNIPQIVLSEILGVRRQSIHVLLSKLVALGKKSR
jgi:hypothetical protein